MYVLFLWGFVVLTCRGGERIIFSFAFDLVYAFRTDPPFTLLLEIALLVRDSCQNLCILGHFVNIVSFVIVFFPLVWLDVVKKPRRLVVVGRFYVLHD